MARLDKPTDPVTDTTNTDSNINFGASLLPMLVGSLALIIIGGIIVMIFV